MERSRKSRHGNPHSGSGFTLIELLTVIAIIGILAALTFPAISRIRLRGRIAAAKEQLRHIETALDQYYAEYDTYPPMGNDWLGGTYWPTEDIGSDKRAPFRYDNATMTWVVNDIAGSPWVGPYTAPDTDGTEMNYVLDPGEDLGLDNVPNDPYDNGSHIPNYFSDNDGITDEPSIGERNNRLDGTYYGRLGMFADQDKQGLIDVFVAETYYHYYAGYVSGKTVDGMPKYRSYTGLSGYRNNHPSFYNRWVLYSVGPDAIDHGLHNYYLVMQDGEDVGADAFASDVMDDGSGTPNALSDNDGVLFEPSIGENNGNNDAFVAGTVRETGWTTPGTGSEQVSPGGNNSLEGPKGEPVFSYDVRQQRRREKAVYITPDGDKVAFGPIMRFGP